MKTYKHTAIGGTFDRLHAGHKHLIRAACTQSERVSLGIMVDPQEDKPFPYTILSYQQRKEEVSSFLQRYDWDDTTVVSPLQDPYGTTLSDKSLDSLFLTEEVWATGEDIQSKRKERGLSDLSLVSVPLLLAEDGDPIASRRIRRGEVSREGIVYGRPFTQRQEFALTTEVRTQVQQPIGEVFSTIDEYFLSQNKGLVITVGDIVTRQAEEGRKKSDVAIVDGRTRRAEIPNFPPSVQRYSNPAGTIQSAVSIHIQDCITSFLHGKQRQQIVVEGEEDLLTIPAVLFAPLNSVVLYGQYNEGVVHVLVTEEMKAYVFGLLQKMESI